MRSKIAHRGSCRRQASQQLQLGAGSSIPKENKFQLGMSSSDEQPGLNLHLNRVTSGPSLGCGNREEEEEASGPASRSVSPSTRSRPVGDGAAAACSVKGISPSADEHGACRPQNVAVGSGSSRPPGSCVAAANVSLLSCGKGLDVGPFETQLLPPQEQVPADPKPSVFLDAPEPSSLESEGNSARRDGATAAAAICVAGRGSPGDAFENRQEEGSGGDGEANRSGAQRHQQRRRRPTRDRIVRLPETAAAAVTHRWRDTRTPVAEGLQIRNPIWGSFRDIPTDSKPPTRPQPSPDPPGQLSLASTCPRPGKGGREAV
ncbi:Zinc finger protein 831 [Pteropus alecto]|uniref:Zinc finger protein 831 n=1 Tax=Pteropus alecto TaxID=9402 RepID=L5JYF3_PTEAL|nr:Zinc finger protein 831 [Pteropus alecto]